MTIRSFSLLGMCLLIGSFPLASFAQSSPAAQPGTAGSTLKPSDKTFATKAAQGGLAEVQMGKMAADKATDPDVKAFGQRMVDDHSKANDQLKSIAQQSGVTLPEGISAKQQASSDKLGKLSGPAFDKAYVKMMVSDHQEDVKEFQKESSSGSSPELKSFAAQTLPTLQSHLDSIKTIQSKMSSQGTK
jgi:putative membrane protein